LNNGTVQNFVTGLIDYDPRLRNMAGVNGLCINPDNNDVFVTTATLDAETDKLYNRIITFESNDGGKTASSVIELLTMDQEQVQSNHLIQFCEFGADGKMYVMVGDSLQGSKTRDLDYFYGKILRINPDGSAVSSNPFYDELSPASVQSYVYAYGFRNAYSADFRPSDNRMLLSENGPDRDRLIWVDEGGDGNYDGSVSSFEQDAVWIYGPSAQSPNGIQWNNQNVFPNKSVDTIFVSLLNRQRVVLQSVGYDGIPTSPETFVEHIGTGAGTILDLKFSDDGLYFTPLLCNDCADGDGFSTGAAIYRVIVDD
jgi:glucose/arabinose dehydrogenase